MRIDKGLSLQESHTIYHTLIQMISQEPQTDWRCGAVQKNKNSNNSVECVLEFQDFINGDQYSGRIRGLCSNGQNAWPVFPIELPYLLLGLSSRVGGWLRHTQASEQIILSVSCCSADPLSALVAESALPRPCRQREVSNSSLSRPWQLCQGLRSVLQHQNKWSKSANILANISIVLSKIILHRVFNQPY